MKYAVVFATFGLACAFYAFTAQFLALRLFAGSCAVAFTGVGLAYGFIGPRAFLKKPDGLLSPLSYALYWPYHLINSLTLLGFRRSGKENPFDQIVENVYLGCRLGERDKQAIVHLSFVLRPISDTYRKERDKQAIVHLGIASVLDLTCEFGETPALRALSYRCIPVLDTRAPSLAQLVSGAEWIQEKIAHGPVYVHCALGHGRSALFVAAYLLISDKAKTAQEAISAIKTYRPGVDLHKEQVSLLNEMVSRRSSILAKITP